ncbi:MAG: hypothetical protein AAFP78_02470 [Pseudomonadota bacterium]
MKDIFEFIAKRALDYIHYFPRIVAHPQRNVLTLVERENALSHAVVFFLVTTAIGLVLQTPFIAEDRDLVTFAAVISVYKVVELAALALALTLVFKLLRGAGSYEKILSATLYIISPVYLAIVVWLIFIGGLLTGYAPELAAEWRRTGELSQGSYNAIAEIDLGVAIVMFFTSFVGPLIVFIWLIASWPIYSRLNGFGRWRTIASFILGLLVTWLVATISLVVLKGLYPKGLGGVI